MEVRRAAAMALAALKEPPSTLAPLLSRRCLEDRSTGLEALEVLGTEAAPYAQDVAARLREPLLRCKALATLGAMGEGAKPHFQMVTGFLGHADATVRLAAVGALQRLCECAGDEEVEAAARLLSHQDQRLRAAGANALAVLGEGKAGKHADAVANMALDLPTALSRGKGRRANSDMLSAADCAALHALGELGEAGAKHAQWVAEQCAGGFSERRRIAMKALSRMGRRGAEHTSVLLRCLDDPDPLIYGAAFLTMVELFEGGVAEETAKAMVAAAHRQEPELLYLSIEMMGAKSAPEQVLEALAGWLLQGLNEEEGGPDVDKEKLAVTAAQAIGQVGQPASHHEKVLHALEAALASKHVGVRASSVQALGAVKAVDLAKNVAEKLSDLCAVRSAAATALGGMAEAGAEHQREIATLLRSPSGLLRLTACDAFGRLAQDNQALHSDVLSCIQEVAGDPIPCVRQAAIKTLEAVM
mmetsp:Transcript_118742/g.369952  ORF Transcript_118742/g.369952 Transcript_118742/m.369952 type:complete len:473 (-) Transcript_118742:46-1464(-)